MNDSFRFSNRSGAAKTRIITGGDTIASSSNPLQQRKKNGAVKYSSCGFEDVDDDLPVLLLLKSGFRDSFFVSSFNRDKKCFETKDKQG